MHQEINISDYFSSQQYSHLFTNNHFSIIAIRHPVSPGNFYPYAQAFSCWEMRSKVLTCCYRMVKITYIFIILFFHTCVLGIFSSPEKKMFCLQLRCKMKPCKPHTKCILKLKCSSCDEHLNKLPALKPDEHSSIITCMCRPIFNIKNKLKGIRNRSFVCQECAAVDDSIPRRTGNPSAAEKGKKREKGENKT